MMHVPCSKLVHVIAIIIVFFTLLHNTQAATKHCTKIVCLEIEHFQRRVTFYSHPHSRKIMRILSPTIPQLLYRAGWFLAITDYVYRQYDQFMHSSMQNLMQKLMQNIDQTTTIQYLSNN